jgi:hypothetical protein
MRLPTVIPAAVFALCSTVSQAAVFHLEDVVVGTIPDMSHQYSDPTTIVSGFFVLDGPFSSSSFLTDYKLTFRDLKRKAFMSVTPPVSPFNWRYQRVVSDTGSTRVTLHNPSFGMSFLLPVGTGVEIDKGTIPLLIYSNQHESRWWNNSTGMMGGYGYPVLSGSLKVDHSLDGRDVTLAGSAPVPEHRTWAVLLAGCVALGWRARRRIV